VEELERIIQRLSIADISGRAFWLDHFRSHHTAQKNTFFEAFQKDHPQISNIAFQMVYRLLECEVKHLIEADRFGALLRWFGPWKSFLPNVRSILSKPWFFGEQTHSQVVTLLAKMPAGSFLVRLYPEQPGMFALDFLDEYNHIIDIPISYHYNPEEADSEQWFRIGTKRYGSLWEAIGSEVGAKEPCLQSPYKNFQVDVEMLPRFANAFLNTTIDADLQAYKKQ